MDLREKIDYINNKLLNMSSKELLNRIGEIKGLYSAYEISGDSEILERVIFNLLDIVDALAKRPSSTERAINNNQNKTGELNEFYNFLNERGKKPTTADNYRKALLQVKRANGLVSLNELESRIDEMITIYEGNDQDAHNAHVAALKQFKIYILERKFLEDKNNHKETM